MTTTVNAAQLAAQLEMINDEIIATVEGCTDAQWRRVTASEQWPVAVAAHHVSEVEGFFAQFAGTVADENGMPPGFAVDDVDESNARHAREFAEVGQAETLAALRANGPVLAQQVRRLSDEQLAAPAGVIAGHEMTVGQLLNAGTLGHFQEHLASIRATIAG